MLLLAAGMAAGLGAYLEQLEQGLRLTGLSRQFTWGAYIGMFTFAVGIAASAVITAIPAVARPVSPGDDAIPPPLAPLPLFAEGMAVAALLVAIACVVADLGRPQNLLGLLLHPSPTSPMFWDMLALSAYLLVTLVLFTSGLESLRHRLAPSRGMRRLLLVSIPLALSIHIITAFLYAGLPDRHYWLTSVLGTRFLASALCSGPALLLLGLGLLSRFTGSDPLGAHGGTARRLLLTWTGWALAAHCLLFGMELFTVLYSGMPAMQRPFALLFDSPGSLLFVSGWLAALLALGLLLHEGLAHRAAQTGTETTKPTRSRKPLVQAALVLVVCSVWIDKAPGMMLGGFTPDSFGEAVLYTPTLTERIVLLGILCAGLAVLSILWRLIVQECRNSHG